MPFAYKEGNDIYNGIIDLLYKKNNEWFIVDYKTNLDPSELDKKYENQLEAYKKALQCQGSTADLEKVKIEDGAPLINTLVLVGAAKSNREARDLITGSSISVNGEKVTDINFSLKKEDAFNSEMTIIKKGKKFWYAVVF